MDNGQIIKGALVGILALGLGASTAEAAPSWAKKGQTLEKCAGIAKAKQNDCGAKGHECAGKAEKDNDPEEWVYVPEGVCAKIAGGTLKATKKI